MYCKVYIVHENLKIYRVPYVQSEVCLLSNVQCAVKSLCCVLLCCAVFIEDYSAVVLLSLLWYSAVVLLSLLCSVQGKAGDSDQAASGIKHTL